MEAERKVQGALAARDRLVLVVRYCPNQAVAEDKLCKLLNWGFERIERTHYKRITDGYCVHVFPAADGIITITKGNGKLLTVTVPSPWSDGTISHGVVIGEGCVPLVIEHLSTKNNDGTSPLSVTVNGVRHESGDQVKLDGVTLCIVSRRANETASWLPKQQLCRLKQVVDGMCGESTSGAQAIQAEDGKAEAEKSQEGVESGGNERPSGVDASPVESPTGLYVLWCLTSDESISKACNEWIEVAKPAVFVRTRNWSDKNDALKCFPEGKKYVGISRYIIGHGVKGSFIGGGHEGVTLIDLSSTDAEYSQWRKDFGYVESNDQLAQAIWRWFKYFLLKKRSIPYFRHRAINPLAALGFIVQSVEAALENGEEDEVRRICRDTRRDWIRGGGQVPEELLVWAQDFLFGNRASGEMHRWSLLDRLRAVDPAAKEYLEPLAGLLGGHITETLVFERLAANEQWALAYFKKMEALVRYPQPELWLQSTAGEGDWVFRGGKLRDYKGIRSIRQWLNAVQAAFIELSDRVKVTES